MIAKHVRMTFATKSDFAGLVAYITGPQGKGERVGQIRITNCGSDELKCAILEILNSQADNSRSAADKTYHLIVSFRPGELPDDATLKAIEERLCAGLGFGDHQRISVVHHDTDNLHMHIAINKIHPQRYTIHEPFRAYHTLAQLCEKLESDHGLEKDNHKAGKVPSENRASDMERHAAVESLLGWIKRECTDKIKQAQSWDQLHLLMQEHGLRIHERANGLVITSESGVSVKASSVNREFSKAKLETRFGSFTAQQGASQNKRPDKSYDKNPLHSRFNTTELYARYKTAQQAATTTRAAEWDKAIARKKRLIEDAKRNARLKRAAIRLVPAPGIGKKLMYMATSKALMDAIAAINQQYLKERQEIYTRYQRKAWADWLRNEATAGDQEALTAMRARTNATGLAGNTLGRKYGKRSPAPDATHDSITKKGTIIYRVGASAVRDDGDRLQVSRGVDNAAIEAALRMATKRYGNCIKVSGTSAFREKVAQTAATLKLPVSFDDEILDQRRQQLIHAAKTKEKKNGNNSDTSAAVRSRPGRGSDGSSRQAATASRACTTGYRTASGAQSDSRNPGQAPPASARHSLRGVSKLGMVHVTNRGEVLLPGHVCGHLEHQRSKPDHRVRRDVRRPGRLARDGRSARAAAEARLAAADADTASRTCKPNVGRVGTAPPPASKDSLQRLSQLGALVTGDNAAPGTDSSTVAEPPSRAETPRHATVGLPPTSPSNAANRYIAEREHKRALGIAMPKHVRFDRISDASAEYAGTRYVNGQALALLKLGAEIIVLPVNEATARQLKRIAVGQQVGLTAKGTIRTKGWSR